MIQRNVGSIGIIDVLESMGIKKNSNTRSALEKMDREKAKTIEKRKDPEVKKLRHVLRGIRKSGQDKALEAEEPSYEAGGFDLPDSNSEFSLDLPLSL